MNILLVEDDRSLGETLKDRLEIEGYHVAWAQNCAAARKSFENTKADLLLLDLGLPDGDGLTLGRELLSKKATPLIYMTAMNTAENRLEGYEIGAEEFIPKPFHLKELLLRIKHVVSNHVAADHVICGEIIIEMNSMAIRLPSGAREYIAARDFALLSLLIKSAPKTLTRDEILDQIWGEDKFPNHRSVDNSIVRLRQLLKDDSGKWIRTVRGMGYQWTQGV